MLVDPHGRPLGDWTTTTVRWDQLRAAWRAAPPERRLVLQDGRPAVLRDETRIETIPPAIWEKVLRWAAGRPWWDPPTRKRERACQACGTALQVRREYEFAWTFWCPACKTAEIHGKNRVGGTPGAGEKEPT